MAAFEAPQNGWQPRFGKVRGKSKPNDAFDGAAACRQHHLIIQIQNAASIGDDDIARVGERETSTVLTEQGLAYLLFELTDLLADGRLRSTDLARIAR
ncbi:hypothetical protein [Bradyrhizobium sp. NAS80.1]|uniref:hypothetical protein n=1 Tax=Bradyrhizobium sp. NAS80.1 TaxID=1680159 RepID=UPI001FDA59AE|nr:hypothetical protein [Bradyrhizobium sp. NAS80.1]